MMAASVRRVGLSVSLALGCAMPGCSMPNPAFDEGDDELGDASSTSAGDGDGDGDTQTETEASASSSESQGDASSSDTSEAETGLPTDLPPEVCTAPFAAPYAPLFGHASQFGGVCPATVSAFLKVSDPGPVAGLLIGDVCFDNTCSECGGGSYVFGVAGLGDFSAPLAEQAEFVKTCVHVVTGAQHGQDEDARCIFDSMWVGEVADRLLVLAHPSPLPEPGLALIEGKPLPAIGAASLPCSCAMTFDPAQDEFDCCVDMMLEPYVASLAFLGADVLPGGVGDVVLDSATWSFHVAQAQLLPNCEASSFSQSWALVRQ